MINRKPESKDPWSTWSGPCRREAKYLHFSLVIPRFCRPSRPSLPGISLSPMCRGWKPIISVPEVGTNCASCVGNCQVRLYVLAITTHLLAAKTDAFGACDSPVDATLATWTHYFTDTLAIIGAMEITRPVAIISRNSLAHSIFFCFLFRRIYLEKSN